MNKETTCQICGLDLDYINCKNINCPRVLWYSDEGKMITDDIFDNDFGFSAASEEELKKYEKQQLQQLTKKVDSSVAEASTYKERLETMYKMIVPLINNLSKDPQKEYILWPGRDKRLAEFKQKLDALMDG